MLAGWIFGLSSLITAVIIPTAAVLGVSYLHRRWNLQLAELETARIAASAQEAVMAAEQKFTGEEKSSETNQQKLNFAVGYLLKTLRRAGIIIDQVTAEEKIEAALGALRSRRAGSAV